MREPGIFTHVRRLHRQAAMPASPARRAALAGLAAGATTLLAPGMVHAATGAMSVPQVVAHAIPGSRLSGSGLFRWWGFAVYTAALWVGPGGIDPARLTAAPFALELRYARNLKGRAIADQSDVEMRKLEQGTAAERAQWLAQMRAIFPDVGDGDWLCGLFEPKTPDGPRTTFWFNGKPIGVVGGEAFAQAFFSIWLSPKTAAPDLRRALLAQAAS